MEGQTASAEQRYCITCGTRLAPQTSFCPSCGAPITEASADAIESLGHRSPGVEYIGFWLRFVASLIDDVVVTVAYSIFWVVALVAGASFGLTDNFGAFFGYFAAFGYFVIFPIVFAYYVIMTGLTGQTLGKMALGIQVINPQGQPPGIWRAFLREVPGKLISALPIYLGYMWAGWDREKRAWHDHLFQTAVVRKPPRQIRNS